MKRFIINSVCLFLFVISTTVVSAQVNFFVGGGASFNTSSNNSEGEQKFIQYSVSPYIAYYITPRFTAGLGLGFQGSKDNTSANAYSKNGQFVFTPFVQYYTKPVNDNLSFYGELGTSFGFGNSKLFLNDTEFSNVKTSSFGVYVGPGIYYFLGKKWGLSALWGALNYNTSKVKDVDGRAANFGLGLSPASLTINLDYYF